MSLLFWWFPFINLYYDDHFQLAKEWFCFRVNIVLSAGGEKDGYIQIEMYLKVSKYEYLYIIIIIVSRSRQGRNEKRH